MIFSQHRIFSFLLLFTLLGGVHLSAQDKKYEVKGLVLEDGTLKPLALATIADTVSGKGVVANEKGEFSFTISQFPVCLNFSYLGYIDKEIFIEDSAFYNSIIKDQVLPIILEKEPVQIEEILISAEKIINLSPERYSHVSDYEVVHDKLLLIGHPGKRPKSYLYLAGLSGNIIDTLPIDKPFTLDKDYNSVPWLISRDSAARINIVSNKISLGNNISREEFNDSISSVLLKWNDQLYFQDKFVGEKGLKTYYRKGRMDSMYLISDIKDSVLLYLLKNRGRDQWARMMGDIAEAIAYTNRGGGGLNPMGGSNGASSGGSSWGSIGSRYITAANQEPIIYGSGKFGAMNINIPEITTIIAPIFRFHGMLIQIDYYKGSINFYNKPGVLIHQVPINYHIRHQAGGTFRDLYHTLVDEVNNEVYIWTQKLTQVEIYQLDIETGQLTRKLDLDSFKNIKKPRIENGNLYFLYSEEHYPYATRLYSMVL